MDGIKSETATFLSTQVAEKQHGKFSLFSRLKLAIWLKEFSKWLKYVLFGNFSSSTVFHSFL
jgi:hypothetical protein